MNFVSFEFWYALLSFLVLRWVISLKLPSVLGKNAPDKKKSRFDRTYLLLSSLLLFGLEDVRSLGIFIGITIVIFTAVTFLPKISTARRWTFTIAVSIVAILPLLFFKYSAFLTGTDDGVVTFEDLVIPIGLSFYTFQLISLLVDRTKALVAGEGIPATQLLDFCNYASFFPQIVAGPIEREKNLLPQLRKFTFKLDLDHITNGFRLVILGLFYKLVMADNLATALPWMHQEINHPILIHLCNVVFGLRIYGDFAGYSFIALGIGRMFGISLTVNFSSPYTRRNVQEFWRTWHVSLTNWFRDYIYIPLGGNKSIITVLIVFAVSGVWHGAGWGFAIWGLMHGIMVMLCVVCKKKIKISPFVAWVLTLIFISVAWLPFYQWDNEILMEKMKLMANPQAYLSSPMAELNRLVENSANVFYITFSLAIAGSLIMMEFLSRRKNTSEKAVAPYRWALLTPVQIFMVIALIVLTPAQNNGFVYFNF